MKTVVITGSTRGIGFGLAEEFLKRGHNAVISGSNREGVTQAVDKLSARYGKESVLGQVCNVGNYAEVQNLWDEAAEQFGRVDIWINNAGLNNPRVPFWNLPPELMEKVVQTNLLGLMYCSKVAMQGMLKQGYGQIYNMEGEGSQGKPRPGLLLYGSTKAALTFLTKGLALEGKSGPVQVCFLSPGIVITNLLLTALEGNDERSRNARRIFNILGDRVETVTPWLVEQILKNDKNGKRIAWLTTPKAFWRLATARFRPPRDLFSEPGQAPRLRTAQG